MQNCTSGYDLLNLPEEIWSKVFTYLRLVDRCCVRLTCHRFYNACNTVSIQRNEQFTFPSCNNQVLSLEPFLNTDRKVWNIRILRLRKVDASVSEFFEKWGVRIHSLILEDCEFSPGLLRSIIEHCRSLRQITLNCLNVSEEFLKIFFDDFAALCDNEIVCGTVSDLNLDLFSEKSSSQLTNLKFIRFFSVFPNVRTLSLIVTFKENFQKSADLRSDTALSLPGIHDQLLKMSNQLENLAIHFRYYTDVDSLALIQAVREITEIEMKNLKELSINWRACLETENMSLVNPNKFSCLSHVYCHIDNVSLSNFIVLLLTTAKELCFLFIGGQRIRFRTHNRTINTRAFVALTQSKLITIDFYLGPLRFDENLRSDLENNPLSPNYMLDYLSLGTSRCDLWELFLKYFRNLCYLNLCRINCNILKNICEFQKNLRSLKVHHCIDPQLDRSPVDCCEMRRWLGLECLPSNRTLPCLTHLAIKEDIPSVDLTKFMVNELIFPKLESLTLRTSAASLAGTHYSSWELICKLPQLEKVHLVIPFAASFQQWLSSVRTLPKLRLLLIEDSAPSTFTRSQYRQLFEVSSSLLTVRHNDAVYYINYTANTLCKCRLLRKKQQN